MPSITGHNHARSASNRSRRLAERYLKTLGLVAIAIEPDKSGALCRLSVIAPDLRGEGHRIWFRSPADADRVLKDLLSRDGRVGVFRAGYRAKCAQHQANKLIRERAAELGIALVSNLELGAQLEILTDRIEREVARMADTGAMAPLNREYAALRKSAAGHPVGHSPGHSGHQGQKLPCFNDWLESRLEMMLANVLTHNSLKSLV